MRIHFTIFLFSLVLMSSSMHSQVLRLTEYAETSGFQDWPTWFEIQNTGDTAINIQGAALMWNEQLLYLAEDTIVPSGEYFTFSTLDYPESHRKTLVHKSMFDPSRTGFTLHFEGDSSRLRHQCVPEGRSYGINSLFQEVHFAQPSLGSENGGEELLFLPMNVQTSQTSGFYTDEVHLELPEPEWANQYVVYTMDGQNLDGIGEVFPQEGIVLTAQTPGAELSYIPASGEFIPPQGTIQTVHVVQVQGFQEACPVSDVRRDVYFIGDEIASKYQLPIISISSQRDALFGAEGIYDFGSSGFNFGFQGRDWERDASVHYFENNALKLEQNVGVRIRGKSSRWAPQKSFKIYAREEYGRSKLPNVFFKDGPDVLKRINIRGNHNDFIRSMMTDHLAMTAVKGLDIDAPNSQQAILFLNGEYWGIYTLQDSMDDHYPESYYGVDDDNVELLDGTESTSLSYHEIITYVRAHPALNDENLDWIRQRVDLDALLLYNAVQIYMANWDWPQKNVKAWTSPIEGERLRYFFFDCDACFNEFRHESLERFYPELNPNEHSILLSTLLRNPEIREQFGKLMVNLVSDPLSSSRLLNMIDETEAQIIPHIEEHIARWSYPQNRANWENSVESLRSFVIRRPEKIGSMMESLLGDKIVVYPNPVQANQFLQVESFGFLTSDFDYQVMNITGVVVQSGTSSIERVQIGDLHPGNYLLQIKKNGFVAYTRFVVMN